MLVPSTVRAPAAALNMVPPAQIALPICALFALAPAATIAPAPKAMALSTADESGFSESSDKSVLTPFPGASPDDLQLQKWIEKTTNELRNKIARLF